MIKYNSFITLIEIKLFILMRKKDEKAHRYAVRGEITEFC